MSPSPSLPRFSKPRSLSLRHFSLLLPLIPLLLLLRPRPLLSPSCVFVLGPQNEEGLGQTLLRNQFALFIAELLHASLSFPSVLSEHGYNYRDLFSVCHVSSHPVASEFDLPDHCILRKHQLLLPACPPSDCVCASRAVARHLHRRRGCRVLGVEHDGFKTREYSGCVSGVMRRYVGGDKQWGREYDAVHFRQGDLKDKYEGNDGYLGRLNNIVNFMCKHSKRDIVVVTEGLPQVPRCGNRVVLAGNTTVLEAVAIMQHANWVGVGGSGLAGVMMEVATPRRVLVNERDVEGVMWKEAKWTVFNKWGADFSFEGRQEMNRAVMGKGGLEGWRRRNLKYKVFDKMEVEVPGRKWELEVKGRKEKER